MDKEKVGKFISELRKENKYSQQELADLIPVGREAVSKWERGMNFPDYQSLDRLSDIFGVTVNEILYGEKESKENKNGVNDVSVELYKDRNKKRKWLIIVSVVLVLVLLVFLSYYFISTYNSLKVYTLGYSSDDLYIYNGLMVTTRDKIYFNIGSISSKEDIQSLKLYYKENNKGITITETDDLTISFAEYVGYEERLKIDNINYILDNMYLDINYEDDTKTIKLDFEKDFTNDKIYNTENRNNILDDAVFSYSLDNEEVISAIKEKFKNENGIYSYTDKEKNYYSYSEGSKSLLIVNKNGNKEWNYHFNTDYLEIKDNNGKLFTYKNKENINLMENYDKNKEDVKYFYECLEAYLQVNVK